MGRRRSEVERQNLTLFFSKQVAKDLREIYPARSVSKVMEALAARHVKRVQENSAAAAGELLREEDLKL